MLRHFLDLAKPACHCYIPSTELWAVFWQDHGLPMEFRCMVSAIRSSEMSSVSGSFAVPERRINVEDVSSLLFGRDTPYIAQLLQENHFSNTVGSQKIITNLKLEVRDKVYCFMYPEEYAMV